MQRGERELVLDLLTQVFGWSGHFALYMDADPLFDPGNVLIAVDEERPVSCVLVFDKRICLADRQIPLGVVTAVGTHPDYRGRGLASHLLAESEERLRRRGVPLALLFSARAGFYARQGWIRVPMNLIFLRRESGAPAPRPDLSIRPFCETDFETVRKMYDEQNANRPGSTVRSASYWHGQLRYAGVPEEQFRIAERGGRPVAYARLVERAGLYLMEHANLPDETRSLAALILRLRPQKRRLFIRSPLPELESALREAGATFRHLRDPTPMWRVLDPVRLAELAGQAGDDEALITELIRKPRAHYWISDRA